MQWGKRAAGIAAVLGVLGALAAAPTAAQDWPARTTVKIIVPYAAGGPMDIPARIVADRLAAQTKGAFILDHRPGHGGSVGTQAVVQAPPDGYTLLINSSSVTMAPALFPSLRFDPLKDLTPLGLATDQQITLVVRPASQLHDLPDLLAKAKANPGKFTFGSGGIGSGNHLAGELLKSLAGVDLTHVPYRGTAASTAALYTGDIDMVFAGMGETLTLARDGRVRMLGLGSHRIPELPNVPAIGEFVPGYDMSNWYALFGPPGLPQPIVSRIGRELAALRADPDVHERLARLGMIPLMSTPEDLRKRMIADVPKWQKVITSAHIKAE